MLLVDTNVSTVGASNPDRKSTSKIYNDLHIVVDFRIVVPEKKIVSKKKKRLARFESKRSPV